ncbi:MAG: dual specificity protein phosphatase family protein [Alphaproteobacteria bacterium]|nr:dual specificity protein phosphatase family protein [Alphaproteobacteria bacterium]
MEKITKIKRLPFSSRRIFFRIAKYPLAIVVVCGAYFIALQLGNNFHEVVPGELYRSAQLSSSAIEEYAQKYQIRTIINLRGENVGELWYDEEVKAAANNNIQHIDFRMAAKRQLTKAQVSNLIAIMRSAPKPILIHCRGGSDRTGLASALYLAFISKKSEFQAELQLTPLYGHVAFKAPAMSETFELVEPYNHLSKE